MGRVLKGDILRSAALISQLGLSIILPVAGGAWLGGYIHQRFGIDGPVSILLILSGVAAGLTGAYRILLKAIDKGKEGR